LFIEIFKSQANNYVANVVLPKLILDAIGESVTDQTFLGSDVVGNPHETNKLSFLEVIASYGPEMEDIVDKSDITEESKLDLLGALRNLQEQIKTDGAAAKRVANYRGNSITGDHEVTLKDGDSVINIPVVDSAIAIDEVVDEVMNHAVTDQTVSASRNRTANINSENVNAEGAKPESIDPDADATDGLSLSDPQKKLRDCTCTCC